MKNNRVKDGWRLIDERPKNNTKTDEVKMMQKPREQK